MKTILTREIDIQRDKRPRVATDLFQDSFSP